jgi:chromosome segregation protein
VLYKRKIKKNKLKADQIVTQLSTINDDLRQAQLEQNKIRDQKTIVEQEERDCQKELTILQTTLTTLRSEEGRLSFTSSNLDSFNGLGLDSSNTLDSAQLQSQISDLTLKKESISDELVKCDRDQRIYREKLNTLQAAALPLRMSLSASPQMMASMLDSRIQSLKDEIARKQLNLTDLNSRENAYKESLKQKNLDYLEAEAIKDKISSELIETVKRVGDLKINKSQTKSASVELNADLCSLKQTLSEIQIDLSQKKKVFDSKSGEYSLRNLIKLLEESKKRSLSGVYGLLIDLLNLPDQIYMAIEKLLNKQLFSVIVDSEETAFRLVELNKELRGGKITVYPLSWSEETPESIEYPDPEKDKCIVLESSVEIKDSFKENQKLSNLVKTILKGNLLVDQLTDAQKLARDYGCNCVTMEGEVIYKGGFLNRLGFTDSHDAIIPDYIAYSSMASKCRETKSRAEDLETKMQDAQNSEAHLNQQLMEASNKQSLLMRQVDGCWEELSFLKKAMVQEHKLAIDSKEQIIDQEKAIVFVEKEIRDLEEVSIKPNNPEDRDLTVGELNNLDIEIESSGEKLTRVTEKMNDLINDMSKLDAQIASTNLMLLTAKRNLQVFGVYEAEGKVNQQLVISTHDCIRGIKNRVHSIEIKERELKAASEKIKNELTKISAKFEKKQKKVAELSNNVKEINQSRFDLQIVIDSFESKLRSLDVDEGKEEEDIWELNKLDNKQLIDKLRNKMIAKLKYTQKDKSNFEKLESHFRVSSDYSSELKELVASKKSFHKIVGNIS